MQAKSYSSAWQLLFSPEAIIPFLLGSLMMAVAGNALYELLTNLLGTNSKAIIAIGFGALLVMAGAVIALKHFVNRLQAAPALVGKKSPEPRKGLILMVSDPEPCRKAIEWHKKTLDNCWLLYSSRSQDNAEELRGELHQAGIKTEMIFISDVYDPIEFKDKVESIYASLPEGWTESDVILDFTGMTGCASVGSVVACLDEARPKQYTPGQYNEKMEAMQPLDPVEIILNWEFPRSRGQSVTSPAGHFKAKTTESNKVTGDV